MEHALETLFQLGGRVFFDALRCTVAILSGLRLLGVDPVRLRHQRVEQGGVGHDLKLRNAELYGVMLHRSDQQVVVIALAVKTAGQARQHLFVQLAQIMVAGADVFDQMGARLVLRERAVDVICLPVQPVEHAMRIEIAETQVLPALLGIEIQDVAEIDGRADGRDVHIVRKFEVLFNAEAENAQGDDVLAAVFDQRVDGNHVLHAAVGVILAAELFQPERGQIGAGQQHIVQLARLQFAGLELQLLPVGQRVGDDEKVNIGVPDLLLVHNLGHPVAQRRHVEAAVAHDVGHAVHRALQLRQGEISTHQALHFFVVHVHDLRKPNVGPQLGGLLRRVHDDHRAVERANRGTGDGGKLQPGLAQRGPRADLVGALGAAAFQSETIGFVHIKFQFHAFPPVRKWRRNTPEAQWCTFRR